MFEGLFKKKPERPMSLKSIIGIIGNEKYSCLTGIQFNELLKRSMESGEKGVREYRMELEEAAKDDEIEKLKNEIQRLKG